MAAKDPVALVRRLMRRDRFAAKTGAVLVEAREGYARARLRLGPEHLNGVAVAQGGAIFTLADFAFAAASNSRGTVAVALDVSITFARATTAGVLEAEAREVTASRRVSVCDVRVTDEDGKVVALFRGTAFRKDDAVADVLAAARERPAPRSRPRATAARRRQAGRSR